MLFAPKVHPIVAVTRFHGPQKKKTKTHYKSTKTGQPDWKDSDWEPAWKNVGHQPLMRNNMTK